MEVKHQQSEMKFAKQLKLYLDKRRMTAAHLSRLTGIARQVLCDWMAGAKPRDIAQVKKIADVFGTSVDHLCFGEGVAEGEVEIVASEGGRLGGGEWSKGVFEIHFRQLPRSRG
jgi:transcriptional regulator with XRE-family HTH domain